MKRTLLAGIGLAGAIVLFTGIAAFAEPDEAEPGAALLTQAEQKGDQTLAGVTTCASAKALSLVAQTKPASTSQEAWDQAVEQAQAKVQSLNEQAREQVETLTDNFDNQVEAAAEEGTALPSLTTLTASLTPIFDPANPTAGVCGQIDAVQITVAPTVTATPPRETDENDSEHETETEHHDSGERD